MKRFWADFPQARSVMVFELLWRLVIVPLLLLVTVGLYRARTWARWGALVTLAALLTTTLVVTDTTDYANDAARAGGMLGRWVLIPALLLWWGYACAFTRKAKRYFGLLP